MIKVKKRNGELVPFDRSKIENALRRAFSSVGQEVDECILQSLVNDVKVSEGTDVIDVENIQDQVEESLMAFRYYNVAKAYILYRAEHNDSRFIRERLEYMSKYVNSGDNAASSSETDANANVTMKNVANLEGEVYKVKNRIIQRQRMKDKLNELYPEVAKQYEKDLENGIIYCHDESSSPALKFYCQAVTLYPLMLEGSGNIDGVTPTPPNDIQSFNGQVTNLVFLLSSQAKGAVACLFGGQPLLIDDKIIKIKDFVNNNWGTPSTYKDWEYCNINGHKIFEEGKYVDISKIYRKKYTDKIYKFTSYKGFVASTSKDHIFKVLRNGVIQEIKAENIRPFETVIVNDNLQFDYSSRDYKEGWLKGMLLGNGCLTMEGAVQLSINYEQDYYGQIFNDYSNELYGDALNKNKGHKCWSYITNKKKLSEQLKNGIIGRNTLDKYIDVSNKSLTYQIGLLDGILSSDGGDHHSVFISLINKNIIDSIKIILDNLHIHYLYKEIQEHDNKQKEYCLDIPKIITRYLPNFTRKVKKPIKSESYYHSGYAKTRKSRRGTNEYIESNSKGHYQFPQYTTDVITSIETFDNTDKYVYEIETSTHWYNCGGFITHNCGDYIVALNYYTVKEFGNEWYNILDKPITSEYNKKQRTVKDAIRKGMKQFIYGINQPAGNRSYNSPFTNISFYDKYYFNALFEGFRYPDGTEPEWKQIDVLQRIFMELLRELRLIKPVTFPVTTMALLHDGHDCKDKDYKELCASEWAKGGSFFCYMSDSPTSLSSCCKVLNEITDNTFSSTIGMTGIMTGSCNVITLNINRIVQDYVRENGKFDKDFEEYFTKILERVYKYQIAYKTMLYDMEDKKMYSCCNAGYIYMKKLYCTLGIIGYLEAGKFLGYDIGDKMNADTSEYVKFLQFIFSIIQKQNRKHSIHDKKRPFVFNVEAIPGEQLAVKFYKKDKADGYYVPEDQNLYSSYFYSPWGTESVLDKLKLHGKKICQYISGGQAAHINLDAHLSKEQYLKIIDFCIKEGVNYFTFNIPISECKDCGHVVNAPIKECPKCHSKKIDWWTRIIGFIRPISTFSKDRQIEANKRIYSDGRKEIE